MASNSLWLRQDTNELNQPWFFFLSAEARIGWMFLKAYVMQASTSQKRPGVAIALDVKAAAYQWRISEASVQELIDAAITAEKLGVVDDEWHVLDKSAFVSEKTLKRNEDLSDKPRQTETNKEVEEPQEDLSDKRGQMPTNGEKGVARYTDTDDVTLANAREARARADAEFDDWWAKVVAIYPKRSGDLKRAGAQKSMRGRWGKFEPDIVMAGVQRYAAWCDFTGKTKTELVKQMTSFFNAEAWREEFELPEIPKGAGPSQRGESAEQRRQRLGEVLGVA